jgi:hypothetical protein
VNILRCSLLGFFFLATSLIPAEAQDASLKACQDEVAKSLAQLNQDYKNSLRELLREFQNVGDLDSFLVVREEITRFDKSPQIAASNIVKEPELLSILQMDCQSSCYEGTNKIVKRHINTLTPTQISLTRAGKIDEAVAVRAKVRAIQAAYKDSLAWDTTSRLAPRTYKVASESLIMGFSRTEALAQRLFQDRRLLVSGVIGKLDRDFAHGDLFNVYFSSPEGFDMQVQFSFKTSEVEVKRAQVGGQEVAVFTKKGDKEKGPLTLKPGMSLEIEGRCEGKHLNVNLVEVSIPDSYWPVVKPVEKPVE